MHARWARLGSLRLRITLAMLGLTALGTSIFAFSVYVAAERLEQSVLQRHIETEFHNFAADAQAQADLTQRRSALLMGFVGRDNADLPSELAALPPGDYHGVWVGEQAYQVRVGDADGQRIYMAYDITEWEALERPVINSLIGGVALSSLLAIALGAWASSQIIAPVTALSKRLAALDPRQRKIRLAPQFDGAELAAIAESFDRYLERLDGFVEREQLFTSAAAHELRTPLAVILGATEVLAEQPDLPPAARRAIARLERAGRDMREFIEALLFLSREDRPGEFEPASAELGRIVRQLADDARRTADAKGLELRVQAREELWLDVPPALPTIVVSNLLRNALEHTDKGQVQIALEGRLLRISDTGRGIAEDAQALLFERDYSTKPGGGLGLHLTKRICDRFSWPLTIASRPGKGTTVSVEFAGAAPQSPGAGAAGTPDS